MCPKSEMSFFLTLNRPLVVDMKTVIGGGTINLDFLKLKSSSNKSFFKKTKECSIPNFAYAAF